MAHMTPDSIAAGADTIGARIRAIRMAQTPPLTQQELAESVGVTPNAIGNYESGRRYPRLATFARICAEYRISPGWLETGEGDMNVPPDVPVSDAPRIALDTIGSRINLIRIMHKPRMKQVELAKSIGVTQGSITAYEAGRSYPQPETLERICAVYHISKYWLETGKGEMLARPQGTPSNPVPIMQRIIDQLVDAPPEMLIVIEHIISMLMRPPTSNR